MMQREMSRGAQRGGANPVFEGPPVTLTCLGRHDTSPLAGTHPSGVCLRLRVGLELNTLKLQAVQAQASR